MDTFTKKLEQYFFSYKLKFKKIFFGKNIRNVLFIDRFAVFDIF